MKSPAKLSKINPFCPYCVARVPGSRHINRGICLQGRGEGRCVARRPLQMTQQQGWDSHPGLLPPSTFPCLPLSLALPFKLLSDILSRKLINRLGSVNSLWREAEEPNSPAPSTEAGQLTFPWGWAGSEGVSRRGEITLELVVVSWVSWASRKLWEAQKCCQSEHSLGKPTASGFSSLSGSGPSDCRHALVRGSVGSSAVCVRGAGCSQGKLTTAPTSPHTWLASRNTVCFWLLSQSSLGFCLLWGLPGSVWGEAASTRRRLLWACQSLDHGSVP